MDEKHCSDLLAGYALDALEGEERAAAERHIMHCPECQTECLELQETLHFCFGHAVPLSTPSPLLRTQFLAHLALEMGPAKAETVPGRPAQPKQALITIQQLATTASVPAGRRLAIATEHHYWWLLGGAAFPAALAIVLGMLFMQSQHQLSDTRAHLLSDALTSPHVIMPLSGVAVSHGMRGEVILPKYGNSGWIIVSGINRVPAGMRFTCWVRAQGHWTASGILQPDASGIAMMAFSRDMDLHHADDVAVTMEHTSQPAVPSSPMLLSSVL